MAGAFEGATRAAIEELIQAHAQPSKFGLLITEDAARDLVSEIYELLVTSRNLKAAGDRFMQGSGPVPQASRESRKPSPFGRPPRKQP